jgi:hypothetical protein
MDPPTDDIEYELPPKEWLKPNDGLLAGGQLPGGQPPLPGPCEWTNDIEDILEAIRINSVILSKEHKRQYFYYKHILRYFKIPVIILSGMNSIISVGFQPYLEQGTISITTCMFSLLCSIICSIELYLAIQKLMENDFTSYKEFYLLSTEIYKVLALQPGNRPPKARDFLEEKYNDYVKQVEKSNAMKKNIEDQLSPLPSPLTPQPPQPFQQQEYIPEDIPIPQV